MIFTQVGRSPLRSCLPLLLLVCACSSARTSESETEDAIRQQAPPPTLGNVCQEHHAGTNADGDDLEICDEPFAQAPFVRPPADVLVADGSGPSTLYVGYVALSGFVTRDGTKYVPLDAGGQPIRGFPDLKSLRLPSHRNLYTIYRITGTVSARPANASFEAVNTIAIESGSPVLMLPGEAIDSQYLGAWEGDTSQRTPGGPDKFDEAIRIPLRFTLTTLEPARLLDGWGSEPPLTDGMTHRMLGTIENWATAVKASDGRCYPALTSLGEKNPFFGAENGDIDLRRLPRMHTRADQVMVITVPAGSADWSGTGMDLIGIFNPAAFLSTSPPAFLDFGPHGTPYGDTLKVRPVTGGGGGC